VLDAVTRAVVATDPRGTILSWNRGAERLYGWAADEVLGRDICEILVPQAQSGQASAIFDPVRRGQEWAGEFVTRHKDGRTLKVAVVDRAVVDDEGRVVAIVGESEDASEERGLAAELRSTRDEQRLALAAGRLGILRWDRETTGVSLDATAESLLGLKPGTFDGTAESWVGMLHPQDREQVLTILDRAVATRGEYDLEYRVIWPDASIHWLQGRGQVTLDDEGEVTGRIGCMADITARRLADEERAHLLSVERSTRSEAETIATRLRGLQAVTMSLIRAVDARSVADAVLTEGVPALGGRTGSILLVADDGGNRRDRPRDRLRRRGQEALEQVPPGCAPARQRRDPHRRDRPPERTRGPRLPVPNLPGHTDGARPLSGHRPPHRRGRHRLRSHGRRISRTPGLHRWRATGPLGSCRPVRHRLAARRASTRKPSWL